MKHLNPIMLSEDRRISQNFPLDFVNVSEKLGRYDNNRREIEKIIEMTKVVPGSRILDAPCGTGRHSGLLTELGFHVTAVDLSATQIERAKLANPGPNYICADMNNLRNLVNIQFDVIINIYSSFGYNNSVGKDQLFLSDVYSLLSRDGHLIMELSDMKRARARLGDRKLPWRRNAHEEIDFDWDTQTLFVRYFEEDTERSHVNMRIYSE